MKFKVGDRVAAYVSGRRYAGEIVQTIPKLLVHVFKVHENYNPLHLHPKQCRKLVKKARRRIWINKVEFPLSPVYDGIHLSRTKPDDFNQWVEFVEVSRNTSNNTRPKGSSNRSPKDSQEKK